VLVATFMFNLGQGILRPAMPLYLQRTFTANYRMVTLIPVVFGVGKWVASLPSGYAMDRLGRRALMSFGLLLIGVIDILSVLTSDYGVFLALRALGGVGWAMFATVATTITIGGRMSQRRGRAVSLLLMSETLGLLLGSTAGGWLYQGLGTTSPFMLEAACLLAASIVLMRVALPDPESGRTRTVARQDRQSLGTILRTPGVVLMGFTNATLIGTQTGVMVFLFPLYLANYRNVGAGMVGLFVSLTVLGRLGALWLGGSASDRWGRMPVLSAGLFLYALVLGSLAFVTQPVALGTWSVAVGAAAGFVMPLPTALVGDRVPVHLQPVAVGWLRTMTDTGHVLGPLVMGALADAVDLTLPFVCAAAMLAIVAGLCHRQPVTQPAAS
jgi:MFS transporter, DHA1 family, multidrug resistance protein